MYLIPKKIIKYSNVENVYSLKRAKENQISILEEDFITAGKDSYFILDFGKETSGGIRILTYETHADETKHIRIRFGESVAETCAELGEKNAANCHSPRDITVLLSSYSDLTFGNTGFRFVRIDFLDEGRVTIKNILAEEKILRKKAVYGYRGKDAEIAKIFKVAKRTIDLCSAEGYLWDGVKRDRLVWMGDIHPEMLALTTLYGRLPIIENSLDFVKMKTPLPNFMNNLSTYSMWWMIILRDYYKQTGVKDYLMKQCDYLQGLLKVMDSKITDAGEVLYDKVFVEWSSCGTEDEILGVKLLNIYAVNCAKEVLVLLGEDFTLCDQILAKLHRNDFVVTSQKAVIALKYFALGEISSREYEMLIKDNSCGFSTFMSYYILSTIAAYDKEKAISLLKEYYGAMLKKGATTFWEDFDISWMENSGTIYALPAKGKKDIHGDYGKYCYQGFRHSLCHGWSSGIIKFIKDYCE